MAGLLKLPSNARRLVYPQNWVARPPEWCYHPPVIQQSVLLVLLGVSQPAAPFPPVGIIDFFGLRQVSEKQARAALGIQEGDRFPQSEAEAGRLTAAAERRLAALPGVRRAKINAVCCDSGKIILYVGMDEGGSDSLKFRAAPTGAARLPADVLAAEQAFEAALIAAVTKGEAGEDDTEGHSLVERFSDVMLHGYASGSTAERAAAWGIALDDQGKPKDTAAYTQWV